jgi:hypothetical protein
LALNCTSAFAQADQPRAAPPEDAQAPEKPSPWFIAPVFTSSPKLGATARDFLGSIHLAAAVIWRNG